MLKKSLLGLFFLGLALLSAGCQTAAGLGRGTAYTAEGFGKGLWTAGEGIAEDLFGAAGFLKAADDWFRENAW
jgi:predicted small secreted protein